MSNAASLICRSAASLISRTTGSLLYRAVEFISMNISATHKVTATLDYRRRWQDFLDDPKVTYQEKGLWIHGASVGELEDLAAFFGNADLLKKAGYQASQLILTTASPSAEEFLKKIKVKMNPRYAGPLPPDVLPRVEEFFEKLNPDLLLLSQSDTWPVMMSVAAKKLSRGALWLPHKSTSASWSKNWLLAPLVKAVALRRQDSQSPLPQLPSAYIGSPRIDRILERILRSKDLGHPLKENLSLNSSKIKILVGSGWKEDANFLKEAIDLLPPEERKEIGIFFIPHEPKNSNEISAISSYLSPYLGKNLILREGILLESYRDFDLAYVGGALRTGLHNIVEPLAWGIPTLCGPDLKKQPEAPHFTQQGALRSLSTPLELKNIFQNFLNAHQEGLNFKTKAIAAREELQAQQGASERLANLIQTL